LVESEERSNEMNEVKVSICDEDEVWRKVFEGRLSEAGCWIAQERRRLYRWVDWIPLASCVSVKFTIRTYSTEKMTRTISR
jgi:hypothetical protein